MSIKKKIEQPVFKFLSRWVAPSLLKLLRLSCTINGQNEEFYHDLKDENFILALWHGQMFPLLFYFGPVGFYTFVSPHRDGSYIARVFTGMGHHSLRTSLRDPRLSSLAEALKLARRGESLAITPDGPLGPRCRAKPGVINLSEHTELPILPAAGLARPAKHFSSWDNFCLPLPFGELAVDFGEPICFWKKNLSMAEKQKQLEERMNRLTVSCTEKLGLEENPMPPAKKDED